MTQPEQPIQEQDVPIPPVMKWFRLYCFFMALIYLLCLAFGVVTLLYGNTHMKMAYQESMVMGGIYSCMGFGLMLPYAAAPFLPRRPWAWVFGLVLIAFTMTSGCCLPLAIPLLIYFIKPDVKQYYGYPSAE